MNVAMRLVSRMPRGPHFMPCAPEYAYHLINDGRVVGRTRYLDSARAAAVAALRLANRRRFSIINYNGGTP